MICLLSNISCGIITYQYLPPVTGISTSMNSQAEVRLPDAADVISFYFLNGRYPYISIANFSGAYFDRYEVHYKIYMSNEQGLVAITDADRTRINPQLQNDFAALDKLTQSKTSVGNNTFRDMGFYELNYDVAYNLVRSNGYGAFTLKPANGYFINSNDLTEEISTTLNADVKTITKTGNFVYTYASLYIVCFNFDDQNLSRFYSSPALINTFFLPAPPSNILITQLNLYALVNNYADDNWNGTWTTAANPITTATITLGRTKYFYFSARNLPSDATTKALTATSSDVSIAEIDYAKNRPPSMLDDLEAFVVKGINNGTVTIKVEAMDGSNVSTSFELEVVP